VTLPEGRESGFCPNCGTKLEKGDVVVPENERTFVFEDNPEFADDGERGRGDDFAFESEQRQPRGGGRPAPAPSNTIAEPTDRRVYGASVQRKRVPKLFVAVGAAVVVVVAAVIFVIPALAGNSYQKAELNFFKSLTEAASLTDGGNLEFSVEYIPADWMSDEIDITDMGIAGSLAYADQEVSANLSLTSDGEKVSDVVYAYDGKEMILALPDLTEYYLRFITGGGSDEGFNLADLDKKKLEATLTEVVKSYFAVTKELTETEKGVDLTGGGVTVKCDEYTIEFTEEAVSKILLSAIDELRKNKNLMEFLASAVAMQYVGYVDYDADYYLGELEDALDEAEEYLSDLDDDERLFRMTVWVKDGDVISRKIDKVADSDVTFSYKKLITKNAAYFEIEVEDNSDSASFSGNFKKAGGAWSGTAKISANSYYGEFLSAKIKCDDIEFSGDQLQGGVNISGTFEDEDMAFDFDLTFGKSGGKQTVEIEGDVWDSYYSSDKYDVGKLSLSYTFDKGGKPKIPKYKDNLSVTVNVYGDEMIDEESAERAAEMAEQLEEFLDDEYDYLGLIGELIWVLWDALDDISGYSDYN
jgi:hypothetical protein